MTGEDVRVESGVLLCYASGHKSCTVWVGGVLVLKWSSADGCRAEGCLLCLLTKALATLALLLAFWRRPRSWGLFRFAYEGGTLETVI